MKTCKGWSLEKICVSFIIIIRVGIVYPRRTDYVIRVFMRVQSYNRTCMYVFIIFNHINIILLFLLNFLFIYFISYIFVTPVA